MNPFKTGDLVVATNALSPTLTNGKVYKVVSAEGMWVRVINDRGERRGWDYRLFEKAIMPTDLAVDPFGSPAPVSNTKSLKPSDGGSSTYYDLPPNARDVDDLIEHKDMNYRIANVFKACYRYGEKAGTSQLYDLKKIIFFAQREVERLEGTRAT